MKESLKILGIESSCDDTGVAIVTASRDILSNIVISQNKEHALFQGVVPEIAARSHLHNLEKALAAALRESGFTLAEVDGIAATTGPGLIGGVIVGSMFGRTLASVLNKPFIAVNHLEGHILTCRLTNDTHFPYLLLLVSGGHSQFIAVQKLGKYKILGQTIDDSVGEAFDKVAKMLNLPFPGGPKIEARAQFGNPYQYTLPKPIINQNNCNMSFSGLKTAVRMLISKLEPIGELEINDIAASFQYVVGEILSAKMHHSIAMYETFMHESILPHKTFVIAGGVAANHYLRTILKAQAEKLGYQFVVAPPQLCTDNAAMIAFAGLERLQNNLTNPLSFCPRARWSLEEL
ncbi:tRNA (adenosine(37)-N6)-threonylcarbamoyltransferase complex transferase subunit TsaD [Candidatus Tisiphia endosymbiont of Nemotelus uliginosus]|uniref:tRNA (adenosine(37)-N6)-threonylcarbamoyltransferase complex transferase subunit TsaD n=1 Tax=Candidatus Tisiphia endosymbiont of Nemotelus uliginosus TaxID=3077926 RepID=UPI0035C903AC